MAHEDDGEESSPIRVWKCSGKHWKRLKRWASLPSWQLFTSGRQVFQCRVCKFTNSYGELCFQCGRKECVVVALPTLKRRRVSAPQLLNDVQKEQLCRVQKRVTALYKPNHDATVHEVALPMETRTVRRRRHRGAAVFSVDDIRVVASLNDEAQFYVQSIFASDIEDHELSPPLTPADSVGEEKETHSTAVAPILPTHHRPLRRKKRFSINRQRSGSLPSRIAIPPCHEKGAAFHGSPLRPRFTSVTSSPYSSGWMSGEIPLGHPSRPLYTAIRKNMLAPITPPSSGDTSPIRRTSASEYIETRAKSLELQTSPTNLVSPDAPCSSRFAHAVDLSSGAGFSVSGETELRMALARRNTIGGATAHPEYKFEYRQNKRSSAVKLTVKKIGQGLRNLVFLRRAMGAPP